MGIAVIVKVSQQYNISMKVFVCLSALVAIAQCGPLNAVLTSGLPAGPVHPQVGNLVATRRGPRPIDLEGFSEDDNQDGFVDPIAPAAPVVYSAPVVHAAPAVTYAAAPVTYTTTYTHPVAYGLHHPGLGLPLAVAPAAAEAEEPAAEGAVVDA